MDSPKDGANPSSPRPMVIPGCSGPEDLRFAYLNLESHPRGEQMLESLVSAGFVPSLVIEERSVLAEKGRASQLEKLAKVPGFRPAMPTGTLCETMGIERITVDHHNDAATTTALASAGIDLAVLGDTRILRQRVIDCVPYGIVNVHPGLLPAVRGNNPYIWSIIHDLPQGATAHLINAGVDRGPILLARETSLPPGTTMPRLIELINRLCADIVVDCLTELVQGVAMLTDQPCDDGLTFREARPEIWTLAATMLRERAEAASVTPHLVSSAAGF